MHQRPKADLFVCSPGFFLLVRKIFSQNIGGTLLVYESSIPLYGQPDLLCSRRAPEHPLWPQTLQASLDIRGRPQVRLQ